MNSIKDDLTDTVLPSEVVQHLAVWSNYRSEASNPHKRETRC